MFKLNGKALVIESFYFVFLGSNLFAIFAFLVLPIIENYPDGKASIEMREKMVVPLITIQQYALLKIKALRESATPDEKLIAVYEKIVTRSLFGNINASRNSA